MTSYLQNTAENSEWPIITAFVLGLLTALSPCPLATNIASVAFASKNISGKFGSFILGLIFALTFCPTSAFIFGMLISLALTAAGGIFLPPAFGAATALSVVLAVVAISFGIGKIGAIYGRLSSFEKHLRLIVGLTFAIIGLHYFYKIYIL